MQIFDGVSAETFGDMSSDAPKPVPVKVKKDDSAEKDAKKSKHASDEDDDEDEDDDDDDDEEQEEFSGEDEDTEEGQTALFDYWIKGKMHVWNNFPRPGVTMKDLGKASWMVNYIHTQTILEVELWFYTCSSFIDHVKKE